MATIRPPRTALSVLVIDDSAVVREAMTAILSQSPGVKVTVAGDPLIAMNKMKAARPDVIVLDLDMPRMHGLDFLKKIMREDPIPVVVCSALTAKGTAAALGALRAGAVDVVGKPEFGVRDFLYDSAAMFVESVRAASEARVRRAGVTPRPAAPAPSVAQVIQRSQRASDAPPRLVAIGASTGGTVAIRELLLDMREDAPPFVIVQHMPPVFTGSYAASLARECRIKVKEAAHGDPVAPGCALIAPGGRHMEVMRLAAGYCVVLRDSPLVSGHRPSVDVLFQSVAKAAGRDAVGVLLTGMGADGAAGLLEMRRAGASTIAEHEATCVVYGMPKEAIQIGAAEEVLPLPQIGAALLAKARAPRGWTSAKGG